MFSPYRLAAQVASHVIEGALWTHCHGSSTSAPSRAAAPHVTGFNESLPSHQNLFGTIYLLPLNKHNSFFFVVVVGMLKKQKKQKKKQNISVPNSIHRGKKGKKIQNNLSQEHFDAASSFLFKIQNCYSKLIFTQT